MKFMITLFILMRVEILIYSSNYLIIIINCYE